MLDIAVQVADGVVESATRQANHLQRQLFRLPVSVQLMVELRQQLDLRKIGAISFEQAFEAGAGLAKFLAVNQLPDRLHVRVIEQLRFAPRPAQRPHA